MRNFGEIALLLIKQKNHDKRFGEFKFEHFGGSDVTNKLMYWQRHLMFHKFQNGLIISTFDHR